MIDERLGIKCITILKETNIINNKSGKWPYFNYYNGNMKNQPLSQKF